ncbi:MAG TPA: FAD:protein FMN transferase [Acidimicrobiales bacterium]|nr:FAD:protein FMN transferase [Acidimicrobiales bacterium]
MSVVRVEFTAIGTTATVVVRRAPNLVPARRCLQDVLEAIDLACSRFRPDSEVTRLARPGGRPLAVSDLLWTALQAAARAHAVTDGRLDPTVGNALVALGYDRDYAALAHAPDATAQTVPAVQPVPAVGWAAVHVDDAERTVAVPDGVVLDLGATAKALAVDLAAAAVASCCPGGALVGVGGDLAVAGEPPPGGWPVKIADSHRARADEPGPVIAVHDGGLATSSTRVRRWGGGGLPHHHIVDPRSGLSAPEVWRTVSVAAASCLDANIASTNAVLLGADAPSWLQGLGLPARLVAADGAVTTVCGWPAAEEAA